MKKIIFEKYNAIPEELKEIPQWVCWALKKNPDPLKKPIKEPINPKTGKNARTNDLKTWGSFDTAVKYFHAHKENISGIGFVFCQNDPYTGIDLDNCVDESGVISEWALAIVNKFQSYTELSQSRTGIHIIIKGKKPDGSGCKKGNIEVYDKFRFFIFTGEVLK